MGGIWSERRVFVSGLSLFLLEARPALALKPVFRFSSGVTQEITGHMEEEKRLIKGGAGEGKNRWSDGQINLCTAKDKYTGKGSVSRAENEEELRPRRRRKSRTREGEREK